MQRCSKVHGPFLVSEYYRMSTEIVHLTRILGPMLCKIGVSGTVGAGNALARVQWVHKPAKSLGHHLLHPLILWLLVLCAPAVLRLRALQIAPAPTDPNS